MKLHNAIPAVALVAALAGAVTPAIAAARPVITERVHVVTTTTRPLGYQGPQHGHHPRHRHGHQHHHRNEHQHYRRHGHPVVREVVTVPSPPAHRHPPQLRIEIVL